MLLLALVAMLPGCSTVETERARQALVIVAGRSNTPAAASPPESLQIAFNRTFDSHGSVTILDASPKPTERILPVGSDAKNEPAIEADRKVQWDMVLRDLAGNKPSAAEAEPWAGVTLGARKVQAARGGGQVFVFDSMLATSGRWSYLPEGMLLAQPSDLTTQAQQARDLPSLSGVSVTLVGAGDVAHPQPPLGVALTRNVIDQQVTLLKAAGATVHLDPTPLTGPSVTGAPPVSVVSLPPPPAAVCSTVLRADRLAFVPDQATFLDPAASGQQLAGIARQLIGTTGPITVTGTTATWGTSEGRQALSLARAQAAANVLITHGVPATRMTVRGLGSDFPQKVPDVNATGDLIPAPAALNRAVFITC